MDATDILRTPRSNKRNVASQLAICTPRAAPTPQTSERVAESLLCREKELAQIRDFISQHMTQQTSGSLYISGTPGIGKTACIDQIYREHEGVKCKINCMGLHDAKTVYSRILADLQGPRRAALPLTPSRDPRLLEKLERLLQDASEMKLIVLDEIDQLQTRDMSLLDRMFRWPTLKGYFVILIGISNKLDLAEHLSIQSRRSGVGVFEKVHFKPYSHAQISQIIEKKFQTAVEGEKSIKLNEYATALVSKRTANTSGDIRAAFSIVKRSIMDASTPPKKLRTEEVSENEPTEVEPLEIGVNISHVHAVMNERSSTKTLNSLPFQQQMLICCALLLTKERKPVTIGSLDSRYSEISQSEGHNRPSQTDIFYFCERLESLGVFLIKKNQKKRNDRRSTVTLTSFEEAEFLVKNNIILEGIFNNSKKHFDA